jgi:RNA polymerase sigma factor (sigma-70 family)
MKKDWLQIILKELHQDAYHWARQCCKFDDDLARDVLQAVYLKILEGKAEYKERSQIKTWLFSVIRFTALESYKPKGRMVALDEYQEEVEEEAAQGYECPEELIQLLPVRQKEVLLLVFYHQLTLEKAAEVLEISIGSVRTHYERGKQNLKKIIIKRTAHENSR